MKILALGCNIFVGFHSAIYSASDCRLWGCKSESQPGHITFLQIDHELFFLQPFSPFNWFKKSNCQLLAKSMCTVLAYQLGGLSLLMKIDWLDLTVIGWLGHNTSKQQQSGHRIYCFWDPNLPVSSNQSWKGCFTMKYHCNTTLRWEFKLSPTCWTL